MLKDWIANEFPIKNVEYRGKVFSFYTDVPNQHMEEMHETSQGLDRVRLMIRLLSKTPKITEDDMAIMPSTMLMALWTGLFPKKATTISPAENTESISSAPSSINPVVKSETGESLRPSA